MIHKIFEFINSTHEYRINGGGDHCDGGRGFKWFDIIIIIGCWKNWEGLEVFIYLFILVMLMIHFAHKISTVECDS